MGTTGVFSLVADENRPPASTPATDPIDPSLSLEPVGVRAHRLENATAGIRFRHTTWSENRCRVLEALLPDDPGRLDWIDFLADPDAPDVEPLPPRSDRSRRFAACGARSIVMKSVDEPVRYKVGCQRCHDRFCLPCMQDRARLIVANLRAQVPYAPTRFLTLTLKHNHAPLREQLDRLYTSFTALRRRQFWKDSVTGGVSFLELKLSAKDDAWHPHLHVLLRGSFLPQKVIAASWLAVTGDSYIVDIRMARSADHLYSYLTRYVTKGWDTGMYRALHKLREAIDALAGRKLLSSFGSFSRLRLLEPPTTETWVELGTLHELIRLSVLGVAWAVTAHAAIFSASYAPPVCVCPPDD